MKATFHLEHYGDLIVNRNWFTGRISFGYEGKKPPMIQKKVWLIEKDGRKAAVTLQGSFLNGIQVVAADRCYEFVASFAWYSYLLAAIPFLMTLILGTLPSLGQAGFYYVGGALGGLLSGGLGILGLFFASNQSKKWARILVGIIMIGITFLVCFGLGNAIAEANRVLQGQGR